MTYTLEKALFIYKPQYGTETFTSDKDYLKKHKVKWMKHQKEWYEEDGKDWEIRYNERKYKENKPTYVDTVWMYAGYNHNDRDTALMVLKTMGEKYPAFIYRIVMIIE